MSENKSRIAIFIILVITIFSTIPLRTLQFEFNIEKLFPQGDRALIFFQQFEEQFNSKLDDEYIFIGFKKTFLRKQTALHNLYKG